MKRVRHLRKKFENILTYLLARFLRVKERCGGQRGGPRKVPHGLFAGGILEQVGEVEEAAEDLQIDVFWLGRRTNTPGRKIGGSRLGRDMAWGRGAGSPTFRGRLCASGGRSGFRRTQ